MRTQTLTQTLASCADPQRALAGVEQLRNTAVRRVVEKT